MTISGITRLEERTGWRRPLFICLVCLILAATVAVSLALPQHPAVVQFVFTSDVHYGITRGAFRGGSNVDAHIVNAAMVSSMNMLADATFPRDGGLKTGEKVGAVDFVVVGGDIANRQEKLPKLPSESIQPAAASWAQFAADYLRGVRLSDPSGTRSPVYVVPGNHDVSNAIGHYTPMAPATDKASMVGIYNLMMTPRVLKTETTYDYATDKVLVSRDVGGLHFMFITMWPDSGVRAWMDRDLAVVSPAMPAMVFTHDQPEAEAKHFRNPNGSHDINPIDRFENLLADILADGTSVNSPTTVEQRALEQFIGRHPNLTAYFHGNSNWNQFYDWTGPDNSVVLHTFRVDSPMKGAVSSIDETKLSFQVVTIDASSRKMTVRECLWNRNRAKPTSVEWGGSTTVAFSPRPATRQE